MATGTFNKENNSIEVAEFGCTYYAMPTESNGEFFARVQNAFFAEFKKSLSIEWL